MRALFQVSLSLLLVTICAGQVRSPKKQSLDDSFKLLKISRSRSISDPQIDRDLGGLSFLHDGKLAILFQDPATGKRYFIYEGRMAEVADIGSTQADGKGPVVLDQRPRYYRTGVSEYYHKRIP